MYQMSSNLKQKINFMLTQTSRILKKNVVIYFTKSYLKKKNKKKNLIIKIDKIFLRIECS